MFGYCLLPIPYHLFTPYCLFPIPYPLCPPSPLIAYCPSPYSPLPPLLPIPYFLFPTAVLVLSFHKLIA